MANILDILNEIGTAIYGRDVRQAIIDAIRQCYEDGKAGVNDLQARTLIEAVMAVNEQQAAEIETLTARVEELEEGESGGSSETSTTSVPTFLVESGIATFENVGANKTATQSISFTESFTEAPTVLAIKVFRQGANTFYSQVTAQPIQSSITTAGFTLAIGNKYTQAVSPSVLWVAFQPTTVEVETEVTTVDGMSEADVRALLAPITAALDSLKIGYDGTEYDTAGASLRQQINALHVLIGDEPGTAISASAISYDGTSSGLSATNVQAAIDETNEKFVGVNGRLAQLNFSLGTDENGNVILIRSDLEDLSEVSF